MQNVRVTGTRNGQVVSAGKLVSSLESSPASRIADAALSCTTTGPQNVAVILVSFPSKPLLSSITPAMMQATYFGSSLSVDSFLMESYSWPDLSRRSRCLVRTVLDARTTTTSPSAVRDAAIRAASNLVDFSNYTRIALVVPQSSTGMESGGLGTIGCSSVPLYPSGSINASTTWLGDVSMGSVSDALAAANHRK